MSKDYASLFQPIKINGLELKNRLVVPPMGRYRKRLLAVISIL